MPVVRMGGYEVGAGHSPLVVAEMSGNHNRRLERALELVDAAAAAGAHAIKLQTYTADSLTLDVSAADFVVQDPRSLWAGRTLHSLYAEAATPREWHPAIFARARERGIAAFSTPFDESAVEYLETLDVPCFKIASFEIVHLPLIRKAASTGKPLVISTGMATKQEISDAVDEARRSGCRELVLLKCTSEYPALPGDANLNTIRDMEARYGCPVGLSDHSLGTAVAVAAVALGASVVEKHLTLGRDDGGVDSAFSLEPAEFAALVRDVQDAWDALGEIRYGPSERELGSLHFRQSIYVCEDVRAGDVFDSTNVRIVRPGGGLEPKHWDQVMGSRARLDAVKGTPLTWRLIEPKDDAALGG